MWKSSDAETVSAVGKISDQVALGTANLYMCMGVCMC